MAITFLSGSSFLLNFASPLALPGPGAEPHLTAPLEWLCLLLSFPSSLLFFLWSFTFMSLILEWGFTLYLYLFLSFLLALFLLSLTFMRKLLVLECPS